MKEHDIQKAIITYLRYALPGAVIFAVPNGGQRNVIVAKKLKAEGVLAGVPDICIIYRGKVFFAEVKNEKGRLTENQLGIIEQLLLNDVETYLLRGVDDAEKMIKEIKELT